MSSSTNLFSHDEKNNLRAEIVKFLDETLEAKTILAMYDPSTDWLKEKREADSNFHPDAKNNKYRVQIFLLHDRDNSVFDLNDYHKILAFLDKQMESYETWSLFEKEFADVVMERIKMIADPKPLSEAEERKLCIKSSLAEALCDGRSLSKREMAEAKEIAAAEVDDRSKLDLGAAIRFIAPNCPCRLEEVGLEGASDAEVWKDVENSIKRGLGTVGYQDYPGGICLRSGFVETENGHQLDKMSRARPNDDRFKEKKKQLKEELADVKAKLGLVESNTNQL